jgi:hypothetical protein
LSKFTDSALSVVQNAGAIVVARPDGDLGWRFVTDHAQLAGGEWAAAGKPGPAPAPGDTCVPKPPEPTSLSTVELARPGAGIPPPGALNLVCVMAGLAGAR